MKAFITGINGFVGGYLKAVLEENSISVFGIDLNVSETTNIFDCSVLDKTKLLGVVKKISPDLVFHLAAQSSVEKSWKEPKLTEEVNVVGTKNLLDSILEAKIGAKVLVVSSGEVYGSAKGTPFKEDSDLSPNNPYSKSRLKQEKLVLDYFDKFRMKVVLSRSFSHTGPGQSPAFVCSSFAKQVAEVEKGISDKVKVGNLDAKRDFSDVRDVVRAYMLAVEKGTTGEIYNICSGKAVSIGSILDTLIGLSNANISVEKDENRMRPSDIPILLGDNTKFVNRTGWKPKIPLKDTLRGLLDYWRQNIQA